MTDTDICIPALENGSTGENGGQKQLPIKWEEEISLEGVNGTIKNSSDIEESIENFEGLLQLNGSSIGQEADTSMLSDQSSSLAASKVTNAACYIILVMHLTPKLYLMRPCNFNNRKPKLKK